MIQKVGMRCRESPDLLQRKSKLLRLADEEDTLQIRELVRSISRERPFRRLQQLHAFVVPDRLDADARTPGQFAYLHGRFLQSTSLSGLTEAPEPFTQVCARSSGSSAAGK